MEKNDGKTRKVPFCRENPPRRINGFTLNHGVLVDGKIIAATTKNSNFATIRLLNTSYVSGQIIEEVGDKERLVRIDLGTTLNVRNHSRTFKLVYDRHGQLTAEEAA
ncbi:MAG: hypothetical protein WCQ60_03835 [bacterium]